MCAPVFPIYICVYNKYIIYIMYIWYIIYTYICIYWCSACAEAMCAPVFRSREQLLTQNAGKPGVVILGALQKLFFYFYFYFSSFAFFSKENSPCLFMLHVLTALLAALIFCLRAGQHAEDASRTALHTPDARASVWASPSSSALPRLHYKPLCLTN